MSSPNSFLLQLNDHDLRRAKANEAIAIFIMSDKYSPTPDDEDAKTILHQYSVQRFLGMNVSNDPLCCMQLIRPENRRHLQSRLDELDDNNRDVVVCLNEMKMGIIAKSVMFAGSSTMIFNLLTSFADSDCDLPDEKKEKKKKRRHQSLMFKLKDKLGFGKKVYELGSDGFLANVDAYHEDYSSDDDDGFGEDDDLTEGNWLEEYQRGCDWEIYTSELSDLFEGTLFIDVASALYAKLGVVLFAIKIRELHGRCRCRIILNPANFKIPPKDECFVEGFVIAKNKVQSDISFADEMEEKENEVSLLKAGIRKAILTSSNYINDSDNAIEAVPGVPMAKGDRFVRKHRLSGSKKKLANKTFLRRQKSDWQLALSESNYTVDGRSNVELSQAQADEALKRDFFVRLEGPREYSECIIHTNVLEEYPYMTNQLVRVCHVFCSK